MLNQTAGTSGTALAPSTGGLTIRKPIVKDVPAMAQLINSYASGGLMLPRSQHKLYQDLRDFVVVMAEGELVGCGALHVIWGDMAEIRSLAIAKAWTGKGLGRRIVDMLIEEAHMLGLPRVFALTYHQAFFERMGFHRVPRETLPHKIWAECLDCPKFPNCDEIAMLLEFEGKEEERDNEG